MSSSDGSTCTTEPEVSARTDQHVNSATRCSSNKDKVKSDGFWKAVKSPSSFSAAATENCRICLQSKSEVSGSLCKFLWTLTCGNEPNALFHLECCCGVGTGGFMCFRCLQSFQRSQGRLCDLCKRPLFSDSGPELLLALLHGSRYLALASLLSLLLLLLSGCLRPELVKSMSGAQPLLPAACAGFLALSAALFALFARQFRAGVCPPCGRHRMTDGDGESGDFVANNADIEAQQARRALIEIL
ncbi:hypothetical protein BOX15_Mlig029921g2 [Macrostomum lignano]|uniref:Uncharacterized protein n=1 Tax=Macrostomum lignano TaxID=282301 RepID=A0A267F8Z6_9PLAT|nr:hypothetical protein BOX15_Mlig029921g1 [Macrostomum lignano]PAA82672.1 hypothetical protein BOX15_Mlig029921g2 [Macrostomum lignano]